MFRGFVLMIGLSALLASGVALGSQEERLAKAFVAARKVRAMERLNAVAKAASDPALVKSLSGTKGPPSLPPEDALPNASWIVIVSPSGDRLAARGEAPVDLGRRPIIQRALESFLRDDLISGQSGPYYVAATPIASNGKVVGVLAAAWLEGEDLDRFAEESCGCQAVLLVGDEVVSGKALDTKAFQALKRELTPSAENQLIVKPLSDERRSVWFPLSGELAGASYLLLFSAPVAASAPPASPARDKTAPIIVLGASLLLGVLLLLLLRASQGGSRGFDEAALILRLPALYQEFIEAKVRCGEPTEGITVERFQNKVREVCSAYAKAYNQPNLVVRVVVKNGRAQISATPQAS